MSEKKTDRSLPNYSRGEEIFNMVSHIVGGSLGIVVLFSCVILAAWHNSPIGVVSSMVYGITMILLYTMSSIYHGLTNERAKKVFRVLDHCTIYFLIAGTYTPMTLVAIRSVDPRMAWSIFAVEWGLAALAVTLTAIDIKKYQVFSMICYIGMGWCVIISVKQVLQAVGAAGFGLLLAGGIMYTVGAVLYGIGKKHKFVHGVFHIFVLFGSFLQYLCVFLYVL